MDATRFDALARSLVAAGSRRDLTRALSTLLLGGGLGLGPRSQAAAKKCGPCRKKKKGKCKKKRPDGTPCPNGGTCQGGACVLPFCLGQNACLSAARCERSGEATCHCFVTAETGQPYCGRGAVPRPCGECTAEETCVDLTGSVCADSGTGCSESCPSPR